MQWESWADFWSMGGKATFVWGSYGLFLILIVLELMFLRIKHKAALNSLLRLRKKR